VVSIIGQHAGEDVETIIARKSADIGKVGRTFWLFRSSGIRPNALGKWPSYVIFIEPASKGGARPATTKDEAKEFSSDGESWHGLPGIGPVTGKLSMATALVIDSLQSCDGKLDLWDYERHSGGPLKFMLGRSTLCAAKHDSSSSPDRPKSRFRDIVAVGRLVEPFCVWLR
jgi:hypothetical protein